MDHDGWERVTRKNARSSHAQQPVTYGRPSTDRDITLDKLRASYKARTSAWRSSSCRAELQRLLEQKRPDDGWQIDNAVCLASGSFSSDNVMLRNRSMTQLAAFMDTVGYAQASSDIPISVHAEELFYSPIDVEFLQSLDVVVHNHGGRDKYIENPVVHSPFGSNSLVFDLFLDSSSLPTVLELLQREVKMLFGPSLPGRSANIDAMTVEAFSKHLPALNYDDVKALVVQFQARVPARHFPRYDPDPSIFHSMEIWLAEPEDDEKDDDQG